MKLKHPVPSFLVKLYSIVSNEIYKSIITWNDRGNGFVIRSQCIFTKDILPKIIKSSKYTSFIRQLNKYNFTKVYYSDQNLIEYINDYFNQENQGHLSLIKKRLKSLKRLRYSTLTSNLLSSSLSYDDISLPEMNELISKATNAGQELQSELDILTEKYSFLAYCNSAVIKRNNEIQDILQYLIKKEKSMENVFSWLIQKTYPSIKKLHNILTNEQLDIPPLIEINQGEFINRLLTQIQYYWNSHLNSNEPKTIFPKNIIDKENLNQLIKLINVLSKDTIKVINTDIFKDIKYCSLLLQFQRNYMANLSLIHNQASYNDLFSSYHYNTFLNNKTDKNDLSIIISPTHSQLS